MCAWLEPIVVSQPGWKSMWTSTIGKARASTQAPADARGKATPRSPPKDVRAATGGHYSGRPDANAPSVAALCYGARPLRKRCTRVPGKHRGSAAARPGRYGHFTLAIFAAGFFQVLLDLTVEEAMIKYGFRYTTAARWGRLRRLYRRAMVLKTLGALLAAIGLALLAPFADTLFNASGLRTPFLLAALLPLSYIPEAPAGAALVLTGRYDVRARLHAPDRSSCARSVSSSARATASPRP